MIIESIDSIANAISELGKASLFDIISLIISAASFIFAILVPVRIANKQDKIALFEKRLNAYLELMKLVQFSAWLENENTENNQVIEAFVMSERANYFIRQFCQSFNCDISMVSLDNVFNKYIAAAIERNRMIVDTIPFLYGRQFKSKREQVTEELKNCYKYLSEFMKSICTGLDDQINRNNFTTTVEKFMQNYKTILITPLKM